MSNVLKDYIIMSDKNLSINLSAVADYLSRNYFMNCDVVVSSDNNQVFLTNWTGGVVYVSALSRILNLCSSHDLSCFVDFNNNKVVIYGKRS